MWLDAAATQTYSIIKIKLTFALFSCLQDKRCIDKLHFNSDFILLLGECRQINAVAAYAYLVKLRIPSISD